MLVKGIKMFLKKKKTKPEYCRERYKNLSQQEKQLIGYRNNITKN